jgi:hypothetical protein
MNMMTGPEVWRLLAPNNALVTDACAAALRAAYSAAQRER